MRSYLWIFLILGFLSSGSIFAQTDLTGTWQGKMEISPDQKLTIQFVISKKDDGSYSAILNSPDTGGIKDIPVDTITFKDETLNLEVSALSGSYSGKYSDKVITGDWKQPGSTLPLVLKPYEKPKTRPTDPLLGEWVGPIDVGIKLTIVLKYNKDEDGQFSGTLDIPEQGANGLPLGEVTLAGDEANFDVPSARIKFKCVLDGETLKGHLIQGNQEIPIEFKKGKYVPPPRELDVPAEAMAKLKGEWVGTLAIVESLPVPVRIRFEENKEGKSRAFFDSPNENMKDIELSDIKLTGDKLALKTTWSRVEGTLKENTISGFYIIGQMQLKINLTKGAELVPLVPTVTIPDDIMKTLSGTWSGKLGETEIAVIFKVNDKGEKEALMQNLTPRKTPPTPLLKASYADNKVTLNTTSGEFSGEIKDGKIEGVYKVLGNVIPISLTKG